MEEEDEFEETLHFNNARITKDEFIIDDRTYSQGFMEYCNNKYHGGQGTEKCFCKTNEQESHNTCQQVEKDWIIYNAMNEPDTKQKQEVIHLEEGKDVPIGQLQFKQKQALHKLLDKNKDLFGRIGTN